MFMQQANDPRTNQYTEEQGCNSSQGCFNRYVAKNIETKKGIPELK
jgi:hypothetical protein